MRSSEHVDMDPVLGTNKGINTNELIGALKLFPYLVKTTVIENGVKDGIHTLFIEVESVPTRTYKNT